MASTALRCVRKVPDPENLRTTHHKSLHEANLTLVWLHSIALVLSTATSSYSPAMAFKRSPLDSASTSLTIDEASAFKRPRQHANASCNNDPTNPPTTDKLRSTSNSPYFKTVTPNLTSKNVSSSEGIFRDPQVQDARLTDEDMLPLKLERAVTLEDTFSFETDNESVNTKTIPRLNLRMRPSFNPFQEQTGFVGVNPEDMPMLLPPQMALDTWNPRGFILETPRVFSPPELLSPPRIQRRTNKVRFADVTPNLSKQLLLPTLM